MCVSAGSMTSHATTSATSYNDCYQCQLTSKAKVCIYTFKVCYNIYIHCSSYAIVCLTLLLRFLEDPVPAQYDMGTDWSTAEERPLPCPVPSLAAL